MKTAQVSQVRARFSKYLDAVRRGQSIEILDRDVPVARLVPIEPSTPHEDGVLPPWLVRQARAGIIRLGTMKGMTKLLKGRRPGSKSAKVVEALIEERRDGR